MPDSIDYGNLMHDALRHLIQSVLEQVAQNGLPGDHHFFITFDTQHPKVAIADWLHDRYPEEMTVVLQHWFDDLQVDENGFAVTLNFGNAPERLEIPFDALRTFVDPSVEFGLRFDSHEDAEIEPLPEPAPHMDDDDEPPVHHDAEVVSLDQFRK